MLKDVAKLFNFIPFLSKVECYGHQVEKMVFWTFLDLFKSLWMTSWLKRKKMHEKSHVDTYLVKLFLIYDVFFLSCIFWPPGVILEDFLTEKEKMH